MVDLYNLITEYMMHKRISPIQPHKFNVGTVVREIETGAIGLIGKVSSSGGYVFCRFYMSTSGKLADIGGSAWHYDKEFELVAMPTPESIGLAVWAEDACRDEDEDEGDDI